MNRGAGCELALLRHVWFIMPIYFRSQIWSSRNAFLTWFLSFYICNQPKLTQEKDEDTYAYLWCFVLDTLGVVHSVDAKCED